LTQIKFLAAWMRQGRLKAKQPLDVGLVYRSRLDERRLRHPHHAAEGGSKLGAFGGGAARRYGAGGLWPGRPGAASTATARCDMQEISAMGSADGRMTDFGLAPKWD
jgi:hypothetical protein